MNRNVLISLFVLAGLSALLGWVLSAPIDIDQASDNDTWLDFENTVALDGSNKNVGTEIKASGIFDVPDVEIGEIQYSSLEEKPEGPPPFPAIKSTSVVNGIAQVHFERGTVGVKTAVEGDTLDSGWVLKNVNLNGVTVTFGDEVRTIKLTNYDLSPESVEETIAKELEE